MPIDLGAMRTSGIQAIAYDRLKVRLGIEGGESMMYDVMPQLAQAAPRGQRIFKHFRLTIISHAPYRR